MEDAEFMRKNRDNYSRKEFREMFGVGKWIVDSVLRGASWKLDETTSKWIEKNNITV